jgi:hypothetical protein
MSFEVPGKGITQRHASTEPDQDGVQSRTYVLRKVANASPDPSNIKTGNAEGEGGQHINTPVPAMKGGKAVPDLRNQLNRSGEHDDDGRSNVHDDRPVSPGDPRQITISKPPRMVVAAQRCEPIERRDDKGENQLADDGHHKPKPCGYFQCGVGDGIQIQPVSQYCCAHTWFSLCERLNQRCGLLLAANQRHL